MSKSADKKTFFLEVEASLGRRLTRKEKKRVLQDRRIVQKAHAQLNPSLVTSESASTQRGSSFIWKYAATSLISIAACLSVVLPITFSANAAEPITPAPVDNKPVVVAPPPINKKYTDIVLINFDESLMRDIKGLLLFKDTTEPEPQIVWLESLIEVAKDAPVLLSYYISEAFIFDDQGEEVAWFSQRIRTYKNYAFLWYYDGLYATIEAAYEANYEAALAGEHCFTTKIVYDDRDPDGVPDSKGTIDVNAFVIEDTVVFCYIDEIQNNTFAKLYFVYGGYEYFIEIQERAFKIDLDFIKTGFMEVLLSNPPTEGKPSKTP